MMVFRLHASLCARGAILAFVCLVGSSVQPADGFAQETQTITNRWKSEYTFQLERVPASEFVRLRTPQGLYVHIEQGPARIGAIEQAWHSAMWTLEPAGTPGFFRLKNRWKGTFLHVERGSLEPSPLGPGGIEGDWHSAMWAVKAQPAPNPDAGQPLRAPGRPTSRPALFTPVPARLVLCAVPDSQPQRYAAGRHVTVGFVNGSERLRERVRVFANTWSKFGNIHFDFIDDPTQARIAVSFYTGRGHYSLSPSLGAIPTRVSENRVYLDHSMNIALTDSADDRELRRVIVHEFGHAIGFIHEQNQAAFNIPWDIAAVLEEYNRTQKPPWTEEDVKRNVLNIYRQTGTQYDRPDPSSIMMYSVDNKLTIGDFEIPWTTELSAKDRETVALWYPYPAGQAPAPGPLVTDYRVTVSTGTDFGAGTDSGIALTIHGTLNSVIDLPLNSQLPGNALEAGAVEGFELRSVPNLGEILSVSVTTRGTDNWFVNSIKVASAAGTYVANYQKWVIGESRTLLSDVVASDPNEAVITVETGDKQDAGTDANVDIQLRGASRSTDWIRLNPLISGNAFERGSRSVAVVDLGADKLGPLKEIGIKHDNRYAAAEWFLQSVTVVYEGKDLHFNLGDWLTSDQRERTLTSGQNSTTYRVTVRTADDADAGTDANVTIRLIGSKGSTNEVRLNGLLTGNGFERGATDEVVFTGFDIGTIDTLYVRRDNQYAAPSWKLQDVVVQKGSARVSFGVNEWIADNTGKPFTPGARQIDYIVDVQTSNIDQAGTDANVYLIIHGDSGSVPEARLNGLGSGNMFERGDLNRVIVRGPNVGRINSIHIRHDNMYSGAGWHLASVRILRGNMGGDAYYFQAKRWIEDTKSVALSPGNPLVDFRLTIVTGTVSGAGTDANVSVRLQGAGGKSATWVMNPYISGNAFENGDTDAVTIVGQEDIGEIVGVEIWHDDAHSGSSWYLSQVRVARPNAPEKTFTCNCWLEGKQNRKWLGVIYP